MKTLKFKHLLIILPVFLLSCFGMNSILKMPINEVDLTKVSDGKHTGTFEKSRWNYTVDVEVKSNEIKSVEVKECPFLNSENGKELNQKLTNWVIEKQSPVIDAVSGATISSKTFQKAVENALNNGIKK